MQAAGGASLSDADESSVASSGTGKARLRLLFAVVAIVCLIADQVAKALAVAHLTPGEPRRLVGSLLRLDLTRNPGAAFSTGMTGRSHSCSMSLFSLLFHAGTSPAGAT